MYYYTIFNFQITDQKYYLQPIVYSIMHEMFE